MDINPPPSRRGTRVRRIRTRVREATSELPSRGSRSREGLGHTPLMAIETGTFVATAIERAMEWVYNWRSGYPGARLLSDYHSALSWVPLEIRQAVLHTQSRLTPRMLDAEVQTEAEIEILLDGDYNPPYDLMVPDVGIQNSVGITDMGLGFQNVEIYGNLSLLNVREADLDLTL